MHTEKKKEKFWNEHSKVRQNRMIYRILGWFIYPFILRTKVRNKVKEGKANWWTKRLWYMINDDELEKHGVDYDVDMVKEKFPWLNINTRFGRFLASYWFNALRNAAYNYLLSHPPSETPVESYTNQERVIDDIALGSEHPVDPLYRAEWVKTNGDIYVDESKIGEGEVWYHPNGNEDISICRYSKAYVKTFLFWNIYITKQKGEFNGGRKYDTIFHIDHVEWR